MRSLLSSLVPAFLLATLPLSDRADTATFRPAAGTKLESTWKIALEARLDGLSLTLNGEEMGPEMTGVPEDLSAKGEVETIWLDHFVKMDGSRPLELVRTVRSFVAEGETSMGQSGKEDGGDEIVDKPMRFRWNADEQSYEREWVEAEGDDESLQHMAIDAGLQGFLPEGAVALGQSWEVRGAPVLRLVIPFFALEDLAEEEDLDFEDVPREVLEQLTALGEEFVVVCTWRGVAEAQGAKLGRIDLSLELDESLQFDPSIFPDADFDEMDVDPITLTLEARLSGFLEWDMDGNHLASLELSGKGSLGLDLSMSHSEGFEMEGSLDASFELSIRGTTQRE